MILTKKQEDGLKIAIERYKAKEKYTCIAGYAGTGKSTLIKFIISALGLYENEVRYIAYTGKAANVLKNKGCPGSMTAHKLLYHARLMPNGKYSFTPKKSFEIEPSIKVVVVDEISMLPKKMWDLLCSHRFYILACGDPEQLPPIWDRTMAEDPNNHVLDNPHIFLTEIMRQAQESEIIRLSMHVREGKPIMTFPCVEEQVMLLPRSQITVPMMTWADQILCATKNTRNVLNQQVRAAYNFDPNKPEIGDKVINLHNEWDIVSNHENPLTNGVIGTIKKFDTHYWDYPFWLRREDLSVPVLKTTISGDEENEEFTSLYADYNEIFTGHSTLTGEEEYLIYKKAQDKRIPLHFNFGYAITVWKAQGSEWNKVLLFQESTWPRDVNERRRYMYTGITRAVDQIVIAV